MTDWDKILDRVLKREGGLADRPLSEDPGGLTNYGITQGLYKATGYQGSVRNLTPESAKAFYRKEIIQPHRLDKLFVQDEWLAEFMFDTVVHHGPTRAFSFLQIALNCFANKPIITIDGRFGPISQKALEAVYAQLSRTSLAQLHSTLKGIRYTYLWTRPHANHNPGWFARVLGI